MTFRLLGCTVLLLLGVHCSAQNDQNDCGPPPRKEIEELADPSDKESYSHDEIVFYKCRPGYITLGRIRYRCNNGNWGKVFPPVDCRKKSCGHPGDIMFGSFELIHGDEFVFGVRVVYRCDEGYQMLSQTNYRDCRAHGWTNDVPHCEVRKCFPVKGPENGRIIMTGIQDLDQEFLFGQVVRFECNVGLKLKGSEQIFCTAHGNWSASVPKCEEITCEPEDIEHGSIIAPKTLYRDGDRIQFSCDHGYKHIGRSDAICTHNGWNTRLACTEIICLPPQVQNGIFQPKENQYRYEDIIQMQCDRGYKGSGQISKCTESGWTPPPKCMLGCDYPIIENGRLDAYYEDRRVNNIPVLLGHPVQFRCNRGFLTSNGYESIRVQCTRSGWNPEPKCLKICRDDVQVPHGRLHGSYWGREYIEGQGLSYTCDRGFSPADPHARARCTKDGWSPNPLCVPEETLHTCENIPVLHGFFFETRERFPLNERAKYRCQSGFTTLEGHNTGETQCLVKGWEPEPKCVQTCSKPSEENAIFNTTKSVFLPEETLNYQCKDGFETLKKTSGDQIACTGNGWVPNPGCQLIQCETLSLENGTVHPRNERYFPKDVVHFSCIRPQHRVGPSSAQCYNFGWSPQPPTCKETVNPCQPPPDISNGTMIGDPAEGYKHGEMVEYECNLKFIMSGSKKIMCLDGKWTTLPSCTEVEEKVCGRPPNITKGYARSFDSDKYFHGETVNYECEQNFVIVGTNPAKCLQGEWEFPSCINHAKRCLRPPNAMSLNFLKQQYDNSEVVTYSCDSNLHETKCVNGKWLPKVECKELCPLPPQLPNAVTIAELKNYENGEEISFRCKAHFLLKGPQTILCEDGRWQTPPECIDLRCSDPPTIDHGEVVKGINSTPRKYLPSVNVHYLCHEGFLISEPSYTTCRNKEWSKVPSCTEKPCGKPPKHNSVIFVGRPKTSNAPGTTMHYKCRQHLTAEGPLNVTCQRGAWPQSPTCQDRTCGHPPRVANADIVDGTANVYLPGHQVRYQCREGFEMPESDTITCENKKWSQAPRCEDVTCSPPPHIPDGQIYELRKQRYLPFEKVRYHCHQPYSLSGPPTVMCSNKRWTAVPRCIDNAGKCYRPPAIENGDTVNIPKPEYMPGDWVRYQCQNLYIMEGSPDVQCYHGHWSNIPRCIVPCTATEEDMRHNNIRLRWRKNEKVYSESGDEIEFSCVSGYRSDPSSQAPFRAQCRNGKLEYPRCIR
ncbi:complement factor H [Elgaria multicarinata webbii]|uniref:complement factor H n=1 Tax=Elgaria multicarinata webbii TaxID=159646 RepID=UPI002FCCE854